MTYHEDIVKFIKANYPVEVVGGNVRPNHTATARTTNRIV